jgi:hypothetical protein
LQRVNIPKRSNALGGRVFISDETAARVGAFRIAR